MVFERSKHECVVCGDVAVDAHHIVERRLWPDGGYYLDNGAALCGECHIRAEQTLISCEFLRESCGIKNTILPPHLYPDQRYDKWGNPILPSGMRLKGELYDDVSVQKILAGAEFVKYIKYPRTYHLPWSPGVGKDDRVMENLDRFKDERIVVTEKMDGENTSMYRDHIHARSVESGSHPSRDRIKAIWSGIAHEIPEGWRVCAENLYARHSIGYESLTGYLMVFSIWNSLRCLSWDETLEWSHLLDLPTVPVIYDGPWSGFRLPQVNGNVMEGYVVRMARSFHYGEFRFAVGKYVRKDHVQTHGGWMRSQVVPNGIARAK